MPDFTASSLSTLDKLRTDRGNNELSHYFHKLLIRNSSKAIKLINEETLSFPTLFLLRPQITRSPISKHLSAWNKNALMITNAIVSRNFSRFSHIARSIDHDTTSILEWILQTSIDEDQSRGQYIEILDSCALILVKEYRDNSILPAIKEIIYNRYKSGLFIHDIVWAFFESRDPNCIMMLAENLNSPDEKDVELSKKLLKFIPVVKDNNLPPEILYTNISYWFRDNYPYIYYTGECFQQLPNPSPFEVSLGAKYLFKKVSLIDGSIESTLTEDEIRLMNIFSSLDDTSKILLSNYSFILHSQNIYWWNNWLHYPITEQLKIASSRLGGATC